ncbi:MAG: ABC transporter substrate-binding protein [Betaproteobacteria bacterium]|nr:ABC transporter substrate-binding protein [Betaproteobacteria bacterium]
MAQLNRTGWLMLIAGALSPPAWAAHGYGQFGELKYPSGFTHFEWANASAPKGGDIALVPPLRITTFDKYNPFTLKGTAPPGLSALTFESLLTGTMDEPTTGYGLLAQDIAVAADMLSVTFRLNPSARFHDGAPVTAEDVKHSFDTLMSKQAAPQYRVVFGDVKRAVVTGPRSIRYEFSKASAELPLLVGGLPVFSRSWGGGKPFDQVVMDTPIGSGPYRIGRMNPGRDITYERDRDYWARDLNVRRGRYNFDRITYKIYKDTTAQTEAFKAGEFDYLRTFSAREWARTYTGKKFDSGELIKAELEFRNAGDFQGFLINTRREKFKDARVREAIGLAFDFEWMNRRLMYNSYKRVRGFFNASDFEANGLPGAGELAILKPLRDKLSPRIFSEEVPQPHSTTPPGSLRHNLRRARELLAAAGWTYRDGALRNAKGEAFALEYLDSGGGERLITPFFQALAKLGIRGDYRRADFALIQKRLDVFDFDLFTVRVPGSEAPGSELLDRFGSRSADTEGSNNLIGVKDPAVDALLSLVVSSRTRPELVARLRALDRVLRHGHYVIPQYYSNTYRLAYRAGKFAQPAVAPKYYEAEDWVISTWWRTKRE